MTDPQLPPAPPDENEEKDERDGKDAKRRDKESRRNEAEQGRLEPSFRYRALLNAVEAGQDLIDLADKKARFSLVIISVLNAVALVLVVRGGETVVPRTGAWGLIVQGELVVYVSVTVYYIWQAIEALRPRGAAGASRDTLPATVVPGESMRVLFHSDVVRREKAAYRRIWDQLRMDNINAELADQLHTVSQINQSKYAALTRLYLGVSIMTAMLTVTLVTIAASHLMP